MSIQRSLETSPTLGALQPSMTLGITAKAKAMKRNGEDVASLCAGEPDFDTPEHIKTAAVEALKRGETKYTPAVGRPELREAVSRKFKEDNGVDVPPGQVVVAPGAKFSVFSAVVCLCSPGDEVVLAAPYWLSYPQMVKASGASPVFVETKAENGFCLTPEQLESAVTDRTKLLILNTPSNPTGAMYSAQSLEAIGRLAVKHDFMVLADEIYEKLVYDEGCRHTSLASLGSDIAERTITVNGFSKAYSMTGWRLGYLAAPQWLTDRVAALQSHSTSNPTSFAQAGALAALEGTQEPVDKMRNAFRRRRDRIYDLLNDIAGITVNKPEGAFYIFPDISSFGIDSMEFAERLLNEAKLAVIPGKPFGADGNIRLSYAYDMDAIEEGCRRLAGFCAKL